MKVNEQIHQWAEMSEEDLDTSKYLFKSGRYLWCMFILHLAFEKLLKAFFVKSTEEVAPFIHDLERLSKIAQIELDESDLQILRQLTKAQISARYESYKQKLMKEFSKGFAKKFFPKALILYTCILKKL